MSEANDSGSNGKKEKLREVSKKYNMEAHDFVSRIEDGIQGCLVRDFAIENSTYKHARGESRRPKLKKLPKEIREYQGDITRSSDRGRKSENRKVKNGAQISRSHRVVAGKGNRARQQARSESTVMQWWNGIRGFINTKFLKAQ
jgi:hypothetical protein